MFHKKICMDSDSFARIGRYIVRLRPGSHPGSRRRH